jgi:hypothetical protein
VINVTGLGPHRLDKGQRPEWFFRRAASFANIFQGVEFLR